MNYIRKARGRSAADFINYLCFASSVRTVEARNQRSQDEFVNHCQELYVAQNGMCALSGVEMIYGWYVRHPCQISIDRIDHSRGYEIGNVRLVTWFVNNMRNNAEDDVVFYFAKKITEYQEQKQREQQQEQGT